VVVLSPDHHKVEGLCTATTASTGREKMTKMPKSLIRSDGNTVVECYHQHSKVMGSSPLAATTIGREKNDKK